MAQFIRHHADYDIGDLTSLLRKDQRPDLGRLIERVVSAYRFLGDLTELERQVVADLAGNQPDLATRLGSELQQLFKR